MRQKQSLQRMVILAVSTLVVLAGGAVFYVKQMERTVKDGIVTSLQEVGVQTGNTVKTKMNASLDNLVSIATLLETQQKQDLVSLADVLLQIADKNNFLRIGIADAQGNVTTTDHVTFNVADRAYFKGSLQGKNMISEMCYDKLSNETIQVYSVPLSLQDGRPYVLFATVRASDQADELLVPSFDGMGFSTIVDANGAVVLNSSSQYADHDLENINDLMFDDHSNFTNMKSGDQGVITFANEQGEKRYFAYTSLEIQNWFICTVVPYSIVSSKLTGFIHIAMITWAVVALCFTLLIVWMYFTKLRHAKTMEDLVYHDALVNHSNFNQFRLDANKLFIEKRHTDYALIDFDISDFKMLNELYGYEKCDEILRKIMIGLEALRNPDEFCSRINADHFVAMWKERDKKVIRQRIHTLVDTVNASLEEDIRNANIAVHFGVYLLDKADHDISKCHDRAVYAKKQIKKIDQTNVSYFSSAMYERIVEDKKLENRMETALENHEFKVYLQPKVQVEDNRVCEAEALVRWEEPSRGLLSPGVFIPLFEKNGFLEKLDMYMIDEVCQLLKKWQKSGHSNIRVSVNVSRSYIFKEDFVKRLYALVVLRHHVDPSFLEIEITESVIFDRIAELQKIIADLKKIGFHISMDDFGSGYSSLNMLKEIPIDTIKLDQAFFQGKEENKKRAHTIIKGVIQLGKLLDIKIVAEGIETKEEVDFLRENKCDLIQGFYFYKPLPVTEFEKLL